MVCKYCGNHIDNGEDYYEFEDGIICEDCINDYLRDHSYTAGEEDPRDEPEYWEDR